MTQRTTSGEYWSRKRRKPLESFSGNIVRDVSLDATLFIDPRVYIFLQQQQATYASKEIAGFGIVSENGALDWVAITSFGAGSAVDTSVQDGAWCETEAFRETGKGTNLQIHSHPGLSCFWSGTDTSDQYSRIDYLRDFEKVGSYWFVVFDTTNDQYLARKVEWDAEKIRYNDGDCWLGERRLARPNSSPSAISAGATTKSSGVQSYTQYNTQHNYSPYTANGHGAGAKTDNVAKGGTQKQLPLADSGDKALSKKNDGSTAGGTRRIHSGSLALALENYLYNRGARPGFESLGNWTLYQAILDVKNGSADKKISEIAHDLLDLESRIGKIKSVPAIRAYVKPNTLCGITDFDNLSLHDFLYTVEKTVDEQMYSMSPEEILRLSAFDATADGLSYGFVACEITVSSPQAKKKRIDELSAKRFLSPPSMSEKDTTEFFAWLRTHDHEVTRIELPPILGGVRRLRISSVQASMSRMETIEILASILDDKKNDGLETITSIAGDPTISNFDVALLRRCLSAVHPASVALLDGIVPTETMNDQTVKDVVDAVREFCRAAAMTPDAIPDVMIEDVYGEFDMLSVEDIMEVFVELDVLMKTLTINEQWMLYMFFTAASGLIPMPLIVKDYLRVVASNEANMYPEDEAMISLLSLDVGRFALMALSCIITTNSYIAESGGDFSGASVGVGGAEEDAAIETVWVV